MDTSDIRKGLKVIINGEPHVVIDFQFVKPGKGQAFTRTKFRNMLSHAVTEVTYKAGEKLQPADIEERQVQYLYPSGADFVFTDPGNGDQIVVPGTQISDGARWLSDGLAASVSLWNGSPIGIDMPFTVTLQIMKSEPGVRGDSAGGATKAATLSTGAVVQVPLFVQEGEWVKVSTDEGRYLERVHRP